MGLNRPEFRKFDGEKIRADNKKIPLKNGVQITVLHNVHCPRIYLVMHYLNPTKSTYIY
jgi:hypothetical protein